jgi:hypothetical protein
MIYDDTNTEGGIQLKLQQKTLHVQIERCSGKMKIFAGFMTINASHKPGTSGSCL